MMSSSLVWELFIGCVSVAELAIFVLGAVLAAAYMASLWRVRRSFGPAVR